MGVNGREEFTSHYVRLDADWPRTIPGSFSDENEASVHSVLTEGKYRWRSVDAIQKKTGLSMTTVMATLNHLEVIVALRLEPKFSSSSPRGRMRPGPSSLQRLLPTALEIVETQVCFRKVNGVGTPKRHLRPSQPTRAQGYQEPAEASWCASL
jgi:hypothetical protein